MSESKSADRLRGVGLIRRSLRGESSAKHGVALSVAAGVLNILVNIALFPLIVSTIGAAQYGIWLFILTLGQYFFYSDLGVGSAMIYYGSIARGGKKRFSFDQLLSNGIGWACTILIVVLPVFLFIAYRWAHAHGHDYGLSDDEIISLVVIGGVLIASIAIRPYESILIGSGHTALHIANQIAGNAVRSTLVIVFCLSEANVTTIAAAEAVGLCLGPLLAMVYVVRKRIARIRLADMSWSNMAGLFQYSLKSFAVDVVSVGVLSAGTILVGLVKGPAPAAYFALAMKVFNGAGQVLTWTTAPALPVFSQIWHTDPTAARSLVRDLLKIVATAGAVFIVPIAMSSLVWIPHWVADDGVALGIGVCVIIVLVAQLSNTILDPVILACSSFGRPGAILPVQLITAALFIGLGIPLTRSYGIIGTAVALAFAMWIVQPLALVILSRTLGMPLLSEITTSYWLPVLVLAAGATMAGVGEILALWLGVNSGWFMPIGFVTGAVAVVLMTPPGRKAIQGGRLLLEQRM